MYVCMTIAKAAAVVVAESLRMTMLQGGAYVNVTSVCVCVHMYLYTYIYIYIYMYIHVIY